MTTRSAIGCGVALAMLAGLGATAAAQAECPTTTTAAKGFRMELSDGRLVDVAPFDGALVAHTETLPAPKPGATPTEIRFKSVRGLVNVWRQQGDSMITLTPSIDLATIFPLKSGDVHTFAYTVKGPGMDRTADMTMRVGRADQTFAGLCPVDVVRVVKEIVWRDTGDRTRLEQTYAPLLQAIIETKGENTSPGKPPNAFAWQTMTVTAK